MLAVTMLLAGCAATTEATSIDPAPAAVSRPVPVAGPMALGAETGLGRFSKRRAMDDVRHLARTIGTRVRGRRGERRGALYAARRLEALGYLVKIQEFSVDGRTSRNVIARWPDSLRYPVLVGGHVDTVPRSPGANDNASGVAVILEMARLAAGEPQARYVHFAVFGAEEYGTDGRHHVGSQVFVNRLGRRGRRRLAGMVSVDMVADGRPLLVGTAGIGPTVVARTLFRKIDRAGIAVDYRTLCDCSDNGPFEHAGIPGSFMWSGSEPDYHSPSDTVANMDPDDLVRSGRALRSFVKALDRDVITRFRES